jgi:hypothetical protein
MVQASSNRDGYQVITLGSQTRSALRQSKNRVSASLGAHRPYVI